MTPVPRRLRKALVGRTIVVTGSSKGIGRETARLLLRAGARVVINGRRPEILEATLHELRSERIPAGGESPSVSAVACDISTEEGAQALIDHCVATWGSLDGLINNAGVSMRGPIEELRATTLERLFAGNLSAAVLPTVAAIPHLRESRGSVVFVSTVAAIHGFPGVSLYSATKAAAGTFAEALGAEVGASGIGVGTVFLGFVENDPDKTTLSADGRAFHHQRRAMQSQADAARSIVMTLVRRRNTIPVAAGRLLSWAHRIAPALVTRILSRSGGRVHRVSRD